LGFHPAPILLGFVLGSRFEENFRRAMLIARGDLSVFVTRPISAVFIAMCVILIASQIYFRLRRSDRDRTAPAAAPVRQESRLMSRNTVTARVRPAAFYGGTALSSPTKGADITPRKSCHSAP
jgi:hypothetical protein